MGTPPPQIMDIDEFEAKNTPAATRGADDFDEDFYGSEEFNEDEFDSAGRKLSTSSDTSRKLNIIVI